MKDILFALIVVASVSLGVPAHGAEPQVAPSSIFAGDTLPGSPPHTELLAPFEFVAIPVPENKLPPHPALAEQEKFETPERRFEFMLEVMVDLEVLRSKLSEHAIEMLEPRFEALLWGLTTNTPYLIESGAKELARDLLSLGASEFAPPPLDEDYIEDRNRYVKKYQRVGNLYEVARAIRER